MAKKTYYVLTKTLFGEAVKVPSLMPGRFAGYRKGKIYGLLSCTSGLRMKKENRVFFDSIRDAHECGYRPCKNCKPDEAYAELTLTDLLAVADKLFGGTSAVPGQGAVTYNYYLAKFPLEDGWRFSVVNSWQNWMKAGYQTQFGLYKRPDSAVRNFLFYVRDHKIDVQSLMEQTSEEKVKAKKKAKKS